MFLPLFVALFLFLFAILLRAPGYIFWGLCFLAGFVWVTL